MAVFTLRIFLESCSEPGASQLRHRKLSKPNSSCVLLALGISTSQILSVSMKETHQGRKVGFPNTWIISELLQAAFSSICYILISISQAEVYLKIE